jgi:SOS response regulatory protein OraA/RecX
MMVMNKNDPVEAENVASRLAARAEQTSAGLANKLRLRGYTKSAVSEAVEKLAAENIVNDERYATMWLGSRLRRKAESPRALLEKLRAKNIPRATAGEAVKTIISGDAELELLTKYTARFADLSREALRAEGFSPDALDAFLD